MLNNKVNRVRPCKLIIFTGSDPVRGQSVIEVIVAVAIMVIISASSVVAILGSFSSNRLAKEESLASFYATQGLEAVESIRNQDWNNLVNGNYGLTNSGGVWAFSGSSDDPDESGKFTRVVTISEKQRDNDGNFVESGGTVDPETKEVMATVTWNFSPTRSNVVEMTTLLTNWQVVRNIGGVNSGTQPTVGSEDCFVFCQTQGDYTYGVCRGGVPECNENGEDNYPGGNRYCNNEALGATCCCGN